MQITFECLREDVPEAAAALETLYNSDCRIGTHTVGLPPETRTVYVVCDPQRKLYHVWIADDQIWRSVRGVW